MKKNAIVFKPNELIEVVNRPISSMGLKAYNLILQKLQKVQVKSIDKRGKTWGSFVLISECEPLPLKAFSF